MDKDDKVKKHPSFGSISVSRIHGQVNLFGSDVTHGNFIEVQISECESRRSLSRDWYLSGKELISVWMTEMQWAQFVSSFNQGDGTPVTLRHLNGKVMPELPSPEKITSDFQKEVVATVQRSLDSLESVIAKIGTALAPNAKTPGKKDLHEMMRELEMSLMQFKNNLPFVEKQFTEAMEQKMTEAKTSFEGYINTRLRQMGLESKALTEAKAEAPKLLGE